MKLPGSAHAHESLVAACMTLLRLRKIPCASINQRPTKTAKGWRTPGATPGTWDIVACLPLGRVLWLEIKTGRSVLSREQRAFADTWTRAGALFFWEIRDVAELDRLLNEVLRLSSGATEAEFKPQQHHPGPRCFGVLARVRQR